MAGLVPIADPNPVKIRPIKIVHISVAIAIKIHPMTHGMDANLIVFKRPNHSINTAEIKQPIGTERTITDAIHDVSVFVNFKSLSSFSTCGTKIAENANEIPITIWNEAAIDAAKI